MSKYGVGLPLNQFITGFNGHTTASGVKVVGTEQAIKEEVEEVVKAMRGSEGQRMRMKMGELREVVKTSWESGGAKESTLALGRAILG